MSYFNRFKINGVTVTNGNELENAPANTEITSDDGTTYVKNAKGVWDKVVTQTSGSTTVAWADITNKPSIPTITVVGSSLHITT